MAATGVWQAGEALQQMLLTVSADGSAASYLSRLVEAPAARAAVHRLLGTLRPPPGPARRRRDSGRSRGSSTAGRQGWAILVGRPPVEGVDRGGQGHED